MEPRSLCVPMHLRLPPSIFFDMTHDNPTIIAVRPFLLFSLSPFSLSPSSFSSFSCPQKRTLQDTLPTAALVSMAACACASTRGYDDLFPENLSVVKESRLYPDYEECSSCVAFRSSLSPFLSFLQSIL